MKRKLRRKRRTRDLASQPDSWQLRFLSSGNHETNPRERNPNVLLSSLKDRTSNEVFEFTDESAASMVSLDA